MEQYRSTPAAASRTSVAAPARPTGVGLTGTVLAAPRRAPRPDPHAGQRLRPRCLRRDVGAGDVRPLPDLGSAQMVPWRRLFTNPALVAMYGPITSLGIDSIATFKSVLLGGVFLCAARLHRRPAPHAYRGGGRASRAARGRRRRSPRGLGRRPCCSDVLAVLAHRCSHRRLAVGVGLDRRRLDRPRRRLARSWACRGSASRRSPRS